MATPEEVAASWEKVREILKGFTPDVKELIGAILYTYRKQQAAGDRLFRALETLDAEGYSGPATMFNEAEEALKAYRELRQSTAWEFRPVQITQGG